MLIIPPEELSLSALAGVIEAFVLREGTDYGHRDYSLEEKREAVKQALRDGSARIVYHPENEHIEIQLVS